MCIIGTEIEKPYICRENRHEAYHDYRAAEGIPALFCNCPLCTYAREHHKREVRTRSQALIDEKLLIDFPADSYKHALENEIDLSAISYLLITHSHDDHFYPMDLLMRLPDYGKNGEPSSFIFMETVQLSIF